MGFRFRGAVSGGRGRGSALARVLLAAAFALVAATMLLSAFGHAIAPPILLAEVVIVLVLAVAAHAYMKLDRAKSTHARGVEERDRLLGLMNHCRRMSESLNVSFVIESTAAQAVELLKASCARVWLVESTGNRLTLAATNGGKEASPGSSVAIGDGAVGRAARFRVAVTQHDQRITVFAVPMTFRARTVGVIELELPAGWAARQYDVQVIEGFASQAGTAIEAALLCEGAVRERKAAERTSLTDALTGLSNRRCMDTDLEREVARALRHHRALTFVMIDIDYFKAFNDTHGHPRADHVLREVGEILERHVRQDDRVYRYGGEEFAVILPDTRPASAEPVAERLRQAIEEEVTRPTPSTTPVTVSIGVAAFPDNASDVPGLMRLADGALYAAKQQGRNRVVVSSDTDAPAQPDGRVRIVGSGR